MSAAGCARLASDLTTLVTRLDTARRALVRQSRLPEEVFGGLSADAYRRHAGRSAGTVAGAESDLTLLAAALTALGRELAVAEEIRDEAAGSPPERARELRARARGVEHRARERWRTAVRSYEDRSGPGPRSSDPPLLTGTTGGPAGPSSPDPAPSPAAAAAGRPALGGTGSRRGHPATRTGAGARLVAEVVDDAS